MKKTTEFTFDGKTYIQKVDWEMDVCVWYDKDKPEDLRFCQLQDPGYCIASIEEMPVQVIEFFILLDSVDHDKMAAFLGLFNDSLRTILPSDAPKYRRVSPKFADFV